MSLSIHQEVLFGASPERVYKALTAASQFSKVTGGAPAAISPEAGGAFTCFGGMISGRNVEVEPNRRIVQAWRAGNWPAGVYSIVKFELQAEGQHTKLILDHTGFPEGTREHLEAGWKTNYLEPLGKFLA